MNLLAALADGSMGVRLRLDPAIEVQVDEPFVARWVERELSLVVQGWFSPIVMDLEPPRASILRAELELDARRMFERESTQRPGRASDQPLRTHDPSWSPIIEFELLERGGRLLRCMHRLGYEPGFECIRMVLMCPTRKGTLTIAAMHVAKLTGLRETTLMLARAEQAHPGQALFDAPEHDAEFPQHGLTSLRTFGRRTLDPELGGLTITQPGQPLPAGTRVELDGCESSIELPIGYQLPQPGSAFVRSLDPSLSLLIAVGLDEDSPTLLDVWRAPGQIGRFFPTRALERLARRNAREWTQEGARDITITTAAVSGSRHRVEVASTIEFETQGQRRFCLACWFVDDDGAIFRIASSGTPPQSIADHRRLLDSVSSSWRRHRPSG